MAQKLIICEGKVGEDLLQSQPLAGIIAEGYEVSAISGYSTVDNRQMCTVLLAEPATTTTTETATTEETNGETNGESNGESNSEQTSGETEP